MTARVAASVTGNHIDPSISPAFSPGFKHGVSHWFTSAALANHAQSLADRSKICEVGPPRRLRFTSARVSASLVSGPPARGTRPTTKLQIRFDLKNLFYAD